MDGSDPKERREGFGVSYRNTGTITSTRNRWVPSSLALLIVVFVLNAITCQVLQLLNEPIAERVQKCSIKSIHQNLSFLDNAHAVTSQEFILRRDNLAKALLTSRVDAFILEPGYTFQYYGNISQSDWEPWEPEERPFLMIVEPMHNTTTGEIKAKTSFLSPKFEEGRVRMLGIPSEEELSIVTWEEHWNPYETLRTELFGNKNSVTVIVDEEIRDFLVRGLSTNGFNTVVLGEEVEAVRQVKSPAEIELLRAVNTGTVEALRAVRNCLVAGLTENEVMTILDNTLLSVGFSLFFNLVLFEENAALPHGGFVTGDKILKEDTMILIDVGAHYLGYSSDICRSFFMPQNQRCCHSWLGPFERLNLFWRTLSTVATLQNSTLHEEKLKVWDLVKNAQSESSKKFTPNHTAADIDITARTIIANAGYGDMKHRVGHGIGIKAHESPYLHQRNKRRLRPGMTFTAEPGVYLEGRFGIRHEDVYLVKEHGDAEILSGSPATSPYDP
ncbi:metallopeptidase family M24 [Lepidopterella palustris CBS 459.81]|uniref:Metallopeptidase family M24 n=1 Tax=Lepidopterella palustris CBS 459.81 TaxID=1314670 RepID=A0A8E2JCG4_9PEZI|nr:metallopeptidase family M24 [Lepidopterella palustris CBS 459.81]